jgi:hypothetical protein
MEAKVTAVAAGPLDFNQKAGSDPVAERKEDVSSGNGQRL